jgi:hypothetical protein
MDQVLMGQATRSQRYRRTVVTACGFLVTAALCAAPPALAASVLSPSPVNIDFGAADMHFQQTQQANFFNNSASATTVTSTTSIGPDAASFSIQSGQDLRTGSDDRGIHELPAELQFGR